MSEPTTSMRDAIEAAIEATDDVPAAAPAEAAVAASSPEPAGEPAAASSEPKGAAAADLNALSEGEKPDDNKPSSQPRDENGKFKPKSDAIQPGPKAGPKPAPAPQPQVGEKAPASWRPDVREHWGQLPETVRSEIARREVEVQRTLQESAEARKTVEAVMRTIQPYEAFIRAENATPLQAIDNLMSTAARLRTGTAPELATLMSQMINQFGTGRFGSGFIEMLDSALAGQQPKGDPQQLALQQAVQQQLAPVQQFMSQFQQMQAQQQAAAVQSAQNEVANFISKAEFGNDVREDMADILEAAQRRGQEMTLADAYKKACLMNDRVREVLQQRQRAKAGQQQGNAAQRARAAAVQVSGAAPMGALKQEPTDVRSAIEAAISMTSR